MRPAEPRDALGVARVHVRAWQKAYRGLLPDDYLDQLRPEDRARRYDFASTNPAAPATIVAADENGICGFATTAPSRTPGLSRHGELCALYVDPEQWGRGIGSALIAAACDRLLALGFRHAVLWVLAGNTRAERFYRNNGWVCDGLRRTELVWGLMLEEVRYQRVLEPLSSPR